MKKMTFLWAVHFHQPVGNFPAVFSDYSRQVIAPFLDLLGEHPPVRVTLHFSGPLLDYFDQEVPAISVRIRELVGRGQVELLGGGYYEPVPTAIPREDVHGQMAKMRARLKDFGQETTDGFWLPESIWEPHLPEIMAGTGLTHTWLEDTLFHAAGYAGAKLGRPYRIEHLNNSLAALPYDHALSAQLLFQNVDETFLQFKRMAKWSEARGVILAQNGDQFLPEGSASAPLLPLVWLKQWIERLEKEKEWLETLTSGAYLRAQSRIPVAALPSGAEREVEMHALPTDAQLQFQQARRDLHQRHDSARFFHHLRGGAWGGFLTKYPEMDFRHKRMLRLRRRLDSLPEGADREKARKLLWEAQCHTAYWHGERGGCYANYLRDAIDQRLIEVDRMIGGPVLEEDGGDYWLRGPTFGLRVRPGYGGACANFDFYPACYNLVNTLTRRREAYHERLGKHPLPPEDWHLRHLFQEHFVRPKTVPGEFLEGTYVEHGDFVDQPYEVREAQAGEGGIRLVLEREGGLYFEGKRRPLVCRKTYTLANDGRLTVDYNIRNTANLPVDVLFVVEANYSCLADEAPDRFIECEGQRRPCGAAFETKPREALRMVDQTRDLDWRWEIRPAAQIWHHPVYTVGMDPHQARKDYQGSALLLVWPLHLTPTDCAVFQLVTQPGKIGG
jgi:hypothetical protein